MHSKHAQFLFVLSIVGLFPAGRLLAADAEGEWGAIKGKVILASDSPPESSSVKVDKDQDHCLKNGPIPNETFIIDKDSKGVANVFVWLAPPDGKKAKLPIHPSLKEVKDKTVEIDQPCCKFIPHVVAVRVGQEIVVKNSAPINHNVNYQGGLDNPGDNPIVPAGKSITMKDLKASRTPISVSCSIHGWMKAWIRVFDHPYFAVTKADGSFEIKNAPAGKYSLVIWHEGVGWVQGGKNGVPVTIKAGGEVDLGKINLEIPKD